MNELIYYIFVAGIVAAFLWCMARIMKRDNFINSLIISFYENAEISTEELISRIYSYGKNDFLLRKTIDKYNATEEDFRNIFDKLIYWANFKKGRRYVPISSFFFVSSLEKLLKNKGEESKKLTMRMMNHFHI